MADQGNLQRLTSHAEPDGSVGNYSVTSAQQLFVASAGGIETPQVQNFLLRGKPFEDLSSRTMAAIDRPLIVISQDNEAGHNLQSQNEAETHRGVASEENFGITQTSANELPIGNIGTAEVKMVNKVGAAVPSIDTNAVRTTDMTTTPPAQDLSLTFFQQQLMLNHQLFLQQQQTVSALVGKVDGLAKLVDSKQSGSPEVNVRGKQMVKNKAKPHTMSDSNIEDVSSQSDFSSSEEEEDSPDHSETEHRAEEIKDKTANRSENLENKTEVSANLKLLKDLSKEFKKGETVANKVEEALADFVDTSIRSQIDRTTAKELCAKYHRPENCNALVVPKINKELWNTTSLAKTTKEQDKTYQTAQKYLNQGLMPLVQLMDKLVKEEGSEDKFKLATDSFQLLAYAHRDISNLRRQKLKMAVSEKYRPLCNDSTQLSENLLGDDLEKQIKTLDEMRKVGKDLIKYKPEKRKRRHEQYDKSTKYAKYQNNHGYGQTGYRNKEKGSFLDRRSRFYHKPGPHKTNKKEQKQ